MYLNFWCRTAAAAGDKVWAESRGNNILKLPVLPMEVDGHQPLLPPVKDKSYP
jgi:hypothetical protein